MNVNLLDLLEKDFSKEELKKIVRELIYSIFNEVNSNAYNKILKAVIEELKEQEIL